MEKINKYQGQLQGPFEAGQEIMHLIAKQCVSQPSYVKHLGIQTKTDNVVVNPGALIEIKINNKIYRVEVGKTNIYEIGNTKITSIKFLENKDNNTIVDYTAILGEEDKGSTM